jgi:glycosyltransferase involved in cell wall biosynthesis
MKFVLILMVRNESKIIQRCLEAVESVVDAFCVHDTGSTDNTVELANEFIKTRNGCVTGSEWKDFGYNRTLSFKSARDYVQYGLKWDLATTYGLLLDADMVFESGTLKQQPLGELGYTIIQTNGDLDYPNCRLVRMDHPWTCKGVTHEYWDGPAFPMSKSICWINDKNDGGCKSDKFERDARLLEAGLAEKPDDVRYMFYLAQTYHCLGRHEDAIRMYEKRHAAGSWVEEQWYSLYMIGQTYLTLGKPIEFEQYMLKAYELRPGRAESIYKLAKYFREKGQHYKAYQYVLMGKDIPLSKDSLFIEIPVYTDLFHYEETICLYYLNRKSEGLRKGMHYLLTKSQNVEGVLSNLIFYIEPIGVLFENHPIQRDRVGRDYHPTSVCSFEDKQMVRFVNYSITDTGSYDMKEGHYSANHKVRTQNVVWNEDGTTVQMNDASITLPRRAHHILGVEDVRLYRDADGDVRFFGITGEYSDNIRILSGICDLETGVYRDSIIVESPLNASCEKNWIPVNGTDDVIYSWNPLRIGQIEGNQLVFKQTLKTPDFFRHLRGSAVPTRVKDELWCLVHYVHHSTPRKYYHCIVKLDATTYEPKSISLPFVFRKEGIEYCLSMTYGKNELEFIFSSWDDNPCKTRVPLELLEWIQV